MSVVINGYSERGMIWTLFGELARRSDSNQLLAALLNLATPESDISPFAVPTSTTILIEQSFSDFGDADVVLLLDHGSPSLKRIVFIEAKVSCQRPWSLARKRRELAKMFEAGLVPFSNLFCQLHAKQQLVWALQHDRSKLGAGLKFPPWSWPRKIGQNSVVLAAVDRVAEFGQNATYLALIPDTSDFRMAVAEYGRLAGVQCHGWGALSWAQVNDFCQAGALEESLAAFKYNHGQIY